MAFYARTFLPAVKESDPIEHRISATMTAGRLVSFPQGCASFARQPVEFPFYSVQNKPH